MGNSDNWKCSIVDIDARAESIRDAISGLSQLVDVLKDVTSSYEHLLNVIGDARDDWEKCLEWMMSEQDSGGNFVSTDVARRAVLVLQSILTSGFSGKSLDDFEWPSVVNNEKDDDHKDVSERDELLEKNIIKLMSMAGTERDGSFAHWTLENIEYGLSRVVGDGKIDEIKKSISSLTKAGIVRLALVTVADDGEVGHKYFYVLSDGCAEPQKVQSLREKIIEVLSSAVDEDGELTAWTENQLFYAIKRTSASLSRKMVSFEIEKMEKNGEIAVLMNGGKKIIAIGNDAIKKMRDSLSCLGILHESVNEQEVLINADEFGGVAHTGGQGVSAEQGHGLSVDTGSIVGTDLSFMGGDPGSTSGLDKNILAYMRGQPDRLWRDYDISGHLRSVNCSSRIFDEDGSDKPMKKELNLLVENGLVEFIPKSNNPCQREDRWKITNAGMASETRTQGGAK